MPENSQNDSKNDNGGQQSLFLDEEPSHQHDQDGVYSLLNEFGHVANVHYDTLSANRSCRRTKSNIQRDEDAHCYDREMDNATTVEPCRESIAHPGFKSSSVTDMMRFVNVVIFVTCGVLCSSGALTFAEASPPHPIVRPQEEFDGLAKVDLCKQLDILCVHGTCVNGTQPRCVCDQGWKGTSCDTCGGRMKLTDSTGFIIDGYTNYTTNTKCTWLLEAPDAATQIRIRFLHFATECSWDHLYMYGGVSVFDPQLAAYSGLVIPTGGNPDVMPEVVTTGTAYLHFYSDAAYNMSGFNISYTMGPSCPRACSGNGYCLPSGECDCESTWTGPGCNIEACPNNCSYPSGTCKLAQKSCECITGEGPDCSIPPTQGFWEKKVTTSPPSVRTSHKYVMYRDHLYVFYGFDFNNQPRDHVVSLNMKDMSWQSIVIMNLNIDNVPSPRYGHSVASFKSKVYMFGGLLLETNVITKELWEFDLESRMWHEWTMQSGVKAHEVVGHIAHIISDTMYIIFGLNPRMGYLNTVQEFNISSKKWYIPLTSGAIVKGGYGQSSIYDSSSGLIFIHAGYKSTTSSTYALSDELYSYNPTQRTWEILKSSGQPKFLHSAALVDGVMYVFGGNTHNDTSISQGAKCYSTNFLAYNIECNTWYELEAPLLQEDISRYGHIAMSYKDQMYIFGGFNGQMMNDLHVYTPPKCDSFKADPSCSKNPQGISCVWVSNQGCLSTAKVNNRKPVARANCQKPSPEDSRMYCHRFGTCSSCTSTDHYECMWCDSTCIYTGDYNDKCDHNKPETVISQTAEACPVEDVTSVESQCSALHNCHACEDDSRCRWTTKCVSASSQQKKEISCTTPCNQHADCENCTVAHCMWCGNQRRCVESISYVASFPYGQCMEWTTHKAQCPDTHCSGLRTCSACQNSPACGWCDDGSDTGLGVCMEGGLVGPRSNEKIELAKCPRERWYFENCPDCQCNGHSKCGNDTDGECVHCEDDTTGDNCEMCRDGYYGTATNGGNCTMCECNGQADFCDRQSGKCFCHTRGVKGHHCDVCDEPNKYFGDPKDGGTCYYDLSINFKFTFNLSEDKEDSRYQTHINFMNKPPDPERDVDFNINCSSDKALMNITIKTKDNDEEVALFTNISCQGVEQKFLHKDYPFGEGSNTTFYVYVYNFKTPFVVEISFLQLDPIDLIHFFITFFSCFLSLLLIAAVVWKVKQKCDMYRRRQRMVVEMEQMASRPFAACNVNVPMSLEEPFLRQEAAAAAAMTANSRASQRVKKAAQSRYSPSPIALEPMSGNKSAVLTLLVRLPTGDEEYSPAGQQGIAVGSALVTIGNHRKNSTDPQARLDKNVKHRKVTTSDASENCV